MAAEAMSRPAVRPTEWDIAHTATTVFRFMVAKEPELEADLSSSYNSKSLILWSRTSILPYAVMVFFVIKNRRDSSVIVAV